MNQGGPGVWLRLARGLPVRAPVALAFRRGAVSHTPGTTHIRLHARGWGVLAWWRFPIDTTGMRWWKRLGVALTPPFVLVPFAGVFERGVDVPVEISAWRVAGFNAFGATVVTARFEPARTRWLTADTCPRAIPVRVATPHIVPAVAPIVPAGVRLAVRSRAVTVSPDRARTAIRQVRIPRITVTLAQLSSSLHDAIRARIALHRQSHTTKAP